MIVRQLCHFEVILFTILLVFMAIFSSKTIVNVIIFHAHHRLYHQIAGQFTRSKP